MFSSKTLLITGGTGSFGNAVLNRFLDTDIAEIRIFSRDEKKQDDMRKKYNNQKEFDSDKSAIIKFGSFKDYKDSLRTRATIKYDNFPIEIPKSLDEAIKCFIISIAIRLNRRSELIQSKLFHLGGSQYNREHLGHRWHLTLIQAKLSAETSQDGRACRRMFQP